MVSIRDDLRLALDRVEFARAVGIEPDDWQRDLLRSSARRVLLNCSRQSGKSTMAGIIALHRALYFSNSLVLCLAPALRQSQELFSKVLAAYRSMGRPVGARSEGKLSLELLNGSRIFSLPGTDRTVRGYSGVDLLIVDEASRVDDELYFAVRPMLAVSGGTLMMLSTPYGRVGEFYEAWTNGGPGWERYEVPATQCPRISAEFLEAERMALPEDVFRQEYMCEFVASDGQFFPEDAIRTMFIDDERAVFGTPEEVS